MFLTELSHRGESSAIQEHDLCLFGLLYVGLVNAYKMMNGVSSTCMEMSVGTTRTHAMLGAWI